MESLQKSFDYCAQICASSGSNFISSFRLLPQRERRAMEAVYAFMRLADDMADDVGSVSEGKYFLEFSQDTFLKVLQNPRYVFPESPSPQFPSAAFYSILPAVLETIRQYSIPAEYFLEVLRGVQTDLEKNFFRTAEELEDYCYQVASAVGLICLHIWGAPTEEITPDANTPLSRAAISCGKALQWTNILRDVVEDAQNDRLYLPLEDWDDIFSLSKKNQNVSRNMSEKDWEKYQAQIIKNRILSENHTELLPAIEKNLNRAERFYSEASILAEWIPRRNRNVFLLITSVYHQIFKKICRNPEIIFKQRVKLSRVEKVKLYFKIFF